MGRLLVYGSINIDRICRVERIVPPGATIASLASSLSPGGKGANQAVAAALAGAPTALFGSVGPDGGQTLETIAAHGVDVSAVQRTAAPTGVAFIQIDPNGENAIVVDPSANHALDDDAAHALLANELEAGDLLLMQNEATGLAGALRAGVEAGASVWLNAAPSDERIRHLPLEQLQALLVNEDEAGQLAPGEYPLQALARRAPSTLIVLTMGERGGEARLGDASFEWSAPRVDALDTVGCGDAFIGVLAASILDGIDLEEALERAARAAAITATRSGAIPALPNAAEIDSFKPED